MALMHLGADGETLSKLHGLVRNGAVWIGGLVGKGLFKPLWVTRRVREY